MVAVLGSLEAEMAGELVAERMVLGSQAGDLGAGPLAGGPQHRGPLLLSLAHDHIPPRSAIDSNLCVHCS